MTIYIKQNNRNNTENGKKCKKYYIKEDVIYIDSS
jgi:hypothetical protein